MDKCGKGVSCIARGVVKAEAAPGDMTGCGERPSSRSSVEGYTLHSPSSGSPMNVSCIKAPMRREMKMFDFGLLDASKSKRLIV